MSAFRLSRRALLRGAGGVAVALPWLEIMGTPRQSHATSPPAKRFLSVYTPKGTVLEKWRPAGTESDFQLSPILAPFAAVKDNLLVLDGLHFKSAVGEQSQAGMIAMLTGTKQIDQQAFAKGPSVDQVIARLHANTTLPSLELAVRWGTGKAKGAVHAIDILNYATDEAITPIAPQIDLAKAWRALFGALPSAPGSSEADWERSILDAVGERYRKLASQLGAADKQRLEAHLSAIRALEQRLGDVTSAAQRCVPPALVELADYDAFEGLNSASDGSIEDPETDAAIPKAGRLMMDMMVSAMACDLTAVGTLQWSDCEAKHTFPWLGLHDTHAFYAGDGGYDADSCERIATWYSEMNAYLLQRMAAVDMGGHSLLDESVVFFGSELQNPANHRKTDMPLLLAGRGGGLRPGRLLHYDQLSHNNLLVSILNLCGDPATTFGAPDVCDGPLTNLT